MIGVNLELLAEATRIIVETADPDKVILFGSHARGEARSDSDLDLLVVESASFGPHRSRYQEMVRLERAMARFPLATDILVYSREEMERLQNQTCHLVHRALQEGRVLYERP
ncbi:MAG: nucleotidyltransferase domain-containing protein [Magnetococcales bacterium]|nr:nucleotidyltransferase domain-containing protein [Magnetococcales bacterium]NGZ26901.1 nucleotidyltransferase domain-containing protein [Magnetococcales bacterium]